MLVVMIFGCCGAISAQTVRHGIAVDGVNQSIRHIGAKLDSVFNTFTMEMWIEPLDTVRVVEQSTTGRAGKDSSQRFAWWATFTLGSDPAWGAGAGISAGTNMIGVFEHALSYYPPLLVWRHPVSGCTHLAVVYNDKTPALYVNGTLVATGYRSTQPRVHPSVDQFGGGAYGYFHGTISGLTIWNTARTGAEVLHDRDAAPAGDEPALVMYLPLDEDGGTIVHAIGAVPFVDTLVNTPLWVPACTTASVEEGAGCPQARGVARVWITPNPAGTSARVCYTLPAPSRMTVQIVDLLGRVCASPLDAEEPAGIHTVLVDMTRLPAGMYVCRCQPNGVARAVLFMHVDDPTR